MIKTISSFCKILWVNSDWEKAPIRHQSPLISRLPSGHCPRRCPLTAPRPVSPVPAASGSLTTRVYLQLCPEAHGSRPHFPTASNGKQTPRPQTLGGEEETWEVSVRRAEPLTLHREWKEKKHHGMRDSLKRNLDKFNTLNKGLLINYKWVNFSLTG